MSDVIAAPQLREALALTEEQLWLLVREREKLGQEVEKAQYDALGAAAVALGKDLLTVDFDCGCFWIVGSGLACCSQDEAPYQKVEEIFARGRKPSIRLELKQQGEPSRAASGEAK